MTEDDDEREKNLQDVRKRLKGTPAANTVSKVKTEGAARANHPITIEIGDDDDGGGKIGSCEALQQKRGTSDVEVVEPVAPEIHAAAGAGAATAANHDDDIELVGTANETRLPHMRQHCPDNRFVQDVLSSSRIIRGPYRARMTKEGLEANVALCDLCY